MEQDAISTDAIINDESVVFANTEGVDAAMKEAAATAYQVAAERGYLDEFLAECEDLAQKFQTYMSVAAVLATPKEQAIRMFLEVLAEAIGTDVQEATRLVVIAVYVINNKDDFEAA